MKAIVVIPTYNERENIARLLPRLQNLREPSWQIAVLVVDDNSPDGTAEKVKDIARKDKNVHLLLRKKKQGLGAAYLAGMRQAFESLRADLVLLMDADLSHSPRYIPQFLEAVEKGADFVVGSRYIKGGSIPKAWAPHRKFLSVFGNKVVSAVLGKSEISDWTSGYRAIKRQVFRTVAPHLDQMRGYTFNLSFAYYTLVSGFKIQELPIKFKDRTSGKSKLGLEYLFHTPFFLFKTRLKQFVRV